MTLEQKVLEVKPDQGWGIYYCYYYWHSNNQNKAIPLLVNYIGSTLLTIINNYF